MLEQEKPLRQEVLHMASFLMRAVDGELLEHPLIPYVSDSFHDQITSLVRTSIDKKQQSKQLLDQAKSRVEQLIEATVRA